MLVSVRKIFFSFYPAHPKKKGKEKRSANLQRTQETTETQEIQETTGTPEILTKTLGPIPTCLLPSVTATTLTRTLEIQEIPETGLRTSLAEMTTSKEIETMILTRTPEV